MKLLFQKGNGAIHQGGENRQNDNRKQHHAHGEGLRGIDNQEAQSILRHQKFPNDNPDKGKPDIDFQRIEDAGDICRENDLCQYLPFCAAEDANQLNLVFIYLQEAIQYGKNRDDNRGQQSNDDDGGLVIPEPDDDDGGEGGFRQGIEDNEIRLCHIGDEAVPPEQDCRQRAEYRPQKKADHRFPEGCADVQEKRAVPNHFYGCGEQFRRLTEEEGVNPTTVRGNFPEKEKQNKQQHL